MRALAARVLVAFGLRAAPEISVTRVHRGEVEILPGPDARRVIASPIAKLSPEDAAQLLGIPVRVHGR